MRFRQPLQIWLTLLAWAIALPFVGPGHAVLHGLGQGEHGEPGGAAPCAACDSHAGGPVVYGLCERTGCEDPAHHHHESHDDEREWHCVACSLAALDAGEAFATEAPAAATAAPSRPPATLAAFDAAGRPGARAPPAVRS